MMMTNETVDYLINNLDSPVANRIAKQIGLQVVVRDGHSYVRRIPERLTGKALNSALAFGELNHNNRGMHGNVLKADNTIQNKTAIISAKEFKGSKFKNTVSEKDRINALLKISVKDLYNSNQ